MPRSRTTSTELSRITSPGAARDLVGEDGTVYAVFDAAGLFGFVPPSLVRVAASAQEDRDAFAFAPRRKISVFSARRFAMASCGIMLVCAPVLTNT